MRLLPPLFGRPPFHALIVGLVGFAGPASAQAARDFTVVRDIAYLESGRSEKLDLYLPARASGDAPVPGIVWIHGGGLSAGDKAEGQARQICEALTRAGYVCASINYCRGADAWPANLGDCKNAIRFLRVHAAEYQVDPRRIAIFGAGAGGQLALLAGFTGGGDHFEPTQPYPAVSSAVSCVVDLYGGADLVSRPSAVQPGGPPGESDRGELAKVFAAGRAADAGFWREISPVTYLTPAAPPVLIVHGSADHVLDPQQSIALDRALSEHAVPHELELLDRIGEGFDFSSWENRPLPRDLDAVVSAFLREHLGAAPHGTPVMELPAAPRLTVDLDAGWKFFPRDNIHGSDPVFDDAPWQDVNLPHTWNAADGADGGGNYYRGPAWYRRHLTVEPRLAGKRLYLQFDGVSLMADVYVNGIHVGSHKGGFARFRFDVTDALHVGTENVICVRADNGQLGIAPLSADFTFYGGIYRPVSLLATDQVQISTMNYASPGLFVTEDKVSTERADLTVRVEVENYEEKARIVEIVTQLNDGLGRVLESKTLKRRLAAGDAVEARQPLSVIDPHLWDGEADPYLYSITVSLRTDGVVRDAVTQPLGLRFFRVDPAKGFMLNGHYLNLYGVNRHQDRLGKGWAISAADEAEDFGLVRELGATAIRISHYQQAETWYERCDRAGLVAWAEIPFVGAALANREFSDNATQQLRELIRQNYNHPAICFWGVGNETRDPLANRVLEGLAKEVAAEDSTRLSTYASDAKPEDPKNWHTDVVAFNHYAGWYSGEYADFPGWLDATHTAHPQAAIGISEYGAGANVAQHQKNGGRPVAKGQWHPEEYQTELHEAAWLALKSRPFIWSKFIWCLFDFGSDSRNEGAQPGRNDKGLVTFDRQVRKDAFYWYKANWNQEPVVYLAERRFAARTQAATEIKVYANAPEVEVTLNGVSLGKKTAPDHLFRWPGVNLVQGLNRVTATARFGDLSVTDACSWALAATTGGMGH